MGIFSTEEKYIARFDDFYGKPETRLIKKSEIIYDEDGGKYYSFGTDIKGSAQLIPITKLLKVLDV